MADQLCTIAQVKARLFPAGVSDTNDDTMLTEIVEEVSAWIEEYTGRKLVSVVSADYYFDTEDGYVLRIPMGVQTVSFLGVASTHQPDSGGTYTTVPVGDYLLRPKAQDLSGWPFTEIHLSRGTLTGTVRTFGRFDNGAKITAVAGFATTPPSIQAVAIDAAVATYQSRKDGASSAMGVDGIAVQPPYARFFGRGSPQRATLDRYRVWSL